MNLGVGTILFGFWLISWIPYLSLKDGSSEKENYRIFMFVLAIPLLIITIGS
jgi:hypothetical protein